MRRPLLRIAAIARLAPIAPPAHADESEDLARCMIDHSGPQEEQTLKDFLLAVLQETPEAELHQQVGKLSITYLNLASSRARCRSQTRQSRCFSEQSSGTGSM